MKTGSNEPFVNLARIFHLDPSRINPEFEFCSRAGSQILGYKIPYHLNI